MLTQTAWANTGEKIRWDSYGNLSLTARRSSDTWNEPFSDHAAHAAPSSAQRPTDHTSNVPAPFSSPPRHVNNEQLRFDPLADAINYHNAFHEQPRDPHPTVAADTSYRRLSQDLPTPHPYQLAAFNPPAPLPQSLPEQPAHNPTPQQQAHEADYQAVETDSEDDAVMPRNRPAIPVADSPVDLTQSPNMATASQQSRTRKRSSTSNVGDSSSAKKRTKRTSMSTARVDVEGLQDEAPSAEDELLQAQQREALKMQETNKDEGPVKIGQRTCIICLENYTNATTAVCGKILRHLKSTN